MGRLDAESETLIPTSGGVFDVAHTLKGDGFDASEDGTGRGTPLIPIAFDCKASGQAGFGVGEVASTMRAMGHANSHTNGGGHQAVMDRLGVRRLMPIECERLQGYSDGYTDIRHGGKPTPDGPRYKALGNSMAIPPMRWLGRRIAMVDAIQALQEAA